MHGLPLELSSQPGMGSLLRGSSFCWVSWFVGYISLLLGVSSTGTRSPGSGAWDSGDHTFLKQIQGGSVLFHVNMIPEAELEDILWAFGPESDYRVMMIVRRGADTPTWFSLQDKYKQRVHVPNMTSLRIENLTLEDSGQYWAQVSFTGGIELTQVFHLTVCEPVPLPQILANPPSITASWYNVTLECTVTGATEDLRLTWESKGLFTVLRQRGPQGPVTNTSTLVASLPLSLSQPNASITCVVSNSMNQKNATLDLGEVCSPQQKSRPVFFFPLLWMMLTKGLLLLGLLGKLGVQLTKKKIPAEIRGKREVPKQL
ncbi:SLAM family member 9-like [Dasypus novemcinctus]|uniref:SLAM family member 9-like n=1 Tax=Dasypus novemcinctus TaxID=9361 RepID=UPI000328F9F8|nr:uncharacterized protein LOC101428768 [Dasypus novemcinctus]